ncbi:MAG TPA: serine hydrolase [Pyrinomonadaceae bacterium]|jgi:CubicO group peptidase (beta-lactamase class C family)/ketosteroid isomerase-like protein
MLFAARFRVCQLILLSLLLSGGFVAAQKDADNQSVREVRSAVEKLAAGFNNRDAEAVVSSFASDAYIINPTRGTAHFKDLSEGVTKAYAAPGKNPYTVLIEIEEIQTSGDWAFVRLLWLRERNTDKQIISKEKDLEIWRKQPDGKWKLARGYSFYLDLKDSVQTKNEQSPAQTSVLNQQQIDFSVLRETIRQELAATKTPGASVSIIKNGQVIFTESFGVANAETNSPVKPNTLFHLGSLNKMMTAAAIVSLPGEGKIKLNIPIGNYLPNLNERIARLTLHQLLSQTSGLRDEPGGGADAQNERILAEFAVALNESDLYFEPGKYFSYSNLGYALAGAVLEKVTGKSYREAMNERVFTPLSMKRATFRPELAMTFPLAAGHTIDKEGKPQVARPFDVNASLVPAGYVYSNITDFSNFILAIMNNGKFDGKPVFAPETVRQLLTAHVGIPTNVFVNGRYGYGFFLQDFRGKMIAEHGGTQTGFSSEVKMAPAERFAVIVFANRDGARLNKTFEKAFEMFLPAPEKPATTEPVRESAMTNEEMQSYVGTYMNRWKMEIFTRDGKLFLRRFGAEIPVKKIGEGRFSVQPAPSAAAQEFTIDSGVNGKPEAIRMFIWTFKKQ